MKEFISDVVVDAKELIIQACREENTTLLPLPTDPGLNVEDFELRVLKGDDGGHKAEGNLLMSRDLAAIFGLG